MGVESQTRKTFLGATMMGDGRRGIEWDWEEWQWGEAEEDTTEGECIVHCGRMDEEPKPRAGEV